MPIVDDTSSTIGYSGAWQVTGGNSNQYQSGVHSTSSVGATATIRFRGTSVKVYATNPSSPGGGNVRAQFILDGVMNDFTRTSHAVAYYQDLFFQSGALPDGGHTLIVRDADSQVPFNLDFFDIDGTVMPSTSGSRPTTSPDKLIDTTTVVSTAISTSLASHSASGTFSSSSASTPTHTANSTKSSIGVEKTVTAFQFITTSASGGFTEITLYPSAGSVSSATSTSGIPVGALVGAILGVLFLFIVLLLFLCLRRRRRQMAPVHLNTNQGQTGRQADFWSSPIPFRGGSTVIGSLSQRDVKMSQNADRRLFHHLPESSAGEGSNSPSTSEMTYLPFNFGDTKSPSLFDSISPPTSNAGYTTNLSHIPNSDTSNASTLVPFDPSAPHRSTPLSRAEFGNPIAEHDVLPAYRSGRASGMLAPGEITIARG